MEIARKLNSIAAMWWQCRRVQAANVDYEYGPVFPIELYILIYSHEPLASKVFWSEVPFDTDIRESQSPADIRVFI